jgi:hypothetical protein
MEGTPGSEFEKARQRALHVYFVGGVAEIRVPRMHPRTESQSYVLIVRDDSAIGAAGAITPTSGQYTIDLIAHGSQELTIGTRTRSVPEEVIATFTLGEAAAATSTSPSTKP